MVVIIARTNYCISTFFSSDSISSQLQKSMYCHPRYSRWTCTSVVTIGRCSSDDKIILRSSSFPERCILIPIQNWKFDLDRRSNHVWISCSWIEGNRSSWTHSSSWPEQYYNTTRCQGQVEKGDSECGGEFGSNDTTCDKFDRFEFKIRYEGEYAEGWNYG